MKKTTGNFFLGREFERINKLADKLTVRELKRILEVYKNAQKETKKQLEELMSKLTQSSFAEAQRYMRLQKLEKEISKTITSLTKKEYKSLNDFLAEIYTETKAGIYHALDLTFFTPDKRSIIEALRNPIDKLTLNKVLEANRVDIISKLQISISQGLLQGLGYFEIARKAKEIYEIGYKKAEVIAWTEAHRAKEIARQETYEELEDKGFKGQKMWIASLDERTRPAHQALDSVRVEVDKNFESSAGGVGLAPGMMNNAADDIRCRCTSIYIIEEAPITRRAGGRTIPFVSYEEWNNN